MLTHKPAPELEAVSKLSDLFEGFYLCPSVTSHTGSRTIKPKGSYFISTSWDLRGTARSYWQIGIASFYLCAKPVKEIESQAQAGCCDGAIGCFKLIPYKGTDLTALIASDARMIASPKITMIENSDLYALTDRINTALAVLDDLRRAGLLLCNYLEIL